MCGVLSYRSLVSGERPWLVGPAGRGGVCWGHFHSRSGPEPTVDVNWLQILAVATLEVAQTAAGPNVGNVLCKKKVNN